MRAMAILFIGPHRNPDFAHDYHLSPVLAPSHLLAQFPPLIMSCGEKDPFVDDTVIFAGRVREAKRARRSELEQILTGKSAKYSENLRMSVHDTGRDDASTRAMKRELAELRSQTEEDWVQLHIFSDWSHGYMQMAQLMHEARTVINDLADRIDDVFAAKRRIRRGLDAAANARKQKLVPLTISNGMQTPFTSETEIETETDDALTFSPKRRSPRSSFSSTRDRIIGHERSRSRTPHLDKRANGQGSSPTDEEMRHLEPAGAGAHHPASLPFDLLHGADGTVPLAVANGLAAGQTSAATPPTPTAASKPPAKAGQTKRPSAASVQPRGGYGSSAPKRAANHRCTRAWLRTSIRASRGVGRAAAAALMTRSSASQLTSGSK